MARSLRIEKRNGVYHVINRGNYRQDLFINEGAHQAFERCLFEACEKCGWVLEGFCVMTNHFHLLVEVPPKMDQELSDEALINRLSLLYSKDYVGQVGVMLRELAERNKRTDNLRGNGLLSVMCWLLFTYG